MFQLAVLHRRFTKEMLVSRGLVLAPGFGLGGSAGPLLQLPDAAREQAGREFKRF